jgi:hypothetical protein
MAARRSATVGPLESVGDPLREIAPPRLSGKRASMRWKKSALRSTSASVSLNSLRVRAWWPVGTGHEVRLEEAEGLRPRQRRRAGKVLEMVADGRHQLLAHLLERARLEGIDRGQAFGQALVAHGEARPVREVVRISRGQGRPMEEGGRGMAKERFDRHASDHLQELAHVARLEGKHLLEVDAAEENEGPGAHGVPSERYQRTVQGPSSFQPPSQVPTG